MEKRFPLDSIQIEDTRIPVDKTVVFSFSVFTYSAESSFPLGDQTPPGTEFALDGPSFEWGEIGGEFGPDQALFGPLCPHDSWKRKKLSHTKGAEAFAAGFQKRPFCQMGLSSE